MKKNKRRVKITKVEVNRMPKNCVEDCPFSHTEGWGYSCNVANQRVSNYTSQIHPDCPLTLEGD